MPRNLLLLVVIFSIPMSYATDEKLDPSGWTTSESSNWLGPNSCDGKAIHLFDGYTVWNTNDSTICGHNNRSWYSPYYAINNHGQSFRVNFGKFLVISKIKIFQDNPFVRLSSRASPAKDSRLLRDLRLEFSDGTQEIVTFQDDIISEAHLKHPKKTLFIQATIINFYSDYSMAGLAALELEIYGSLSDEANKISSDSNDELVDPPVKRITPAQDTVDLLFEQFGLSE